MVLIITVSATYMQPCNALKTPFLRPLYGQNLAIFLPVCLQFFLRFSALFCAVLRLAYALHVIRLQNRLHRNRLHRVRKTAYM